MSGITGNKVTDNIYICPDGKYRWIYELSMRKNPVLLFTIWKVLGIAAGIVLAFVTLVSLITGNLNGWSGLWGTAKGVLLAGLVLMVLAVVGYAVVAASYGWKYIVLFEMDEEGIVHMQMPKQAEKAEAMGWLTAMAGLVAGSPAAMGSGLLAAAKNSSTSTFSKVRRVIGRRGMNVIKVNHLFEHNQVYVEKADYDFVWKYITGHCTNAKVSGN